MKLEINKATTFLANGKVEAYAADVKAAQQAPQKSAE